jgi:hypothetical protein
LIKKKKAMEFTLGVRSLGGGHYQNRDCAQPHLT